MTETEAERLWTALRLARAVREQIEQIEGLKAQVAALRTWRPMSEARKDLTPILAKIRPDLSVWRNRDDLEHWNGLRVVIRHVGIEPGGFDVGWNMDGPVGMGGFPDEWFVGWMELPA